MATTAILWNEAVDAIAKQEAQQSFFLQRPDIDLRRWHQAIPFLWMLFGEHYGCPQFCGDGFNVCAPSLPPDAICVPTSPAPTSSPSKFDFKISFASANVSTLGIGSRGHAGKLDYIKGQFVNFHLNFLGVQEARTQEGTILKDDILRLCAGADGKHLGVELWCKLKQPFAFVNNKPRFLRGSDFQVIHRDPRRLLVRVQHAAWQTYLLVGHAPHSGIALAQRAIWWSELHHILQACHHDVPLVAMIDANAAPGDGDLMHVLGAGFAGTSGTPFLRQFLETFSLCLPSTGPLHTGPRHTWTAPDGVSQHCIDYVAIPTSWLSRCVWSQSLEDFDLNVTHVDHLPVGLEVSWSDLILCAHNTKSGSGLKFDRSAIDTNDLAPFLSKDP